MEKERSKEDLYAAWGTTREEHLGKMLEFIKSQNERVKNEKQLKSERRRVDAKAVAVIAATCASARAALLREYKEGGKSKRHLVKNVELLPRNIKCYSLESPVYLIDRVEVAKVKGKKKAKLIKSL